MLFRPSKKDIIIAANRKANALLQEEQEAINKRRSVINEHIKVVRQKIDQHLTRESGKCHKRAIRKLTTIAKNMGSKINVVSSRQVEELKTAEAAYDALSSESNKVYQAMTRLDSPDGFLNYLNENLPPAGVEMLNNLMRLIAETAKLEKAGEVTTA